MNLVTSVVALTILTLAASAAESSPSNEGYNEPSIRTFIASAPKATKKVDLSYAINIPEKERRYAIEKCEEMIAKDPANYEARKLRGDLLSGKRLKSVGAETRIFAPVEGESLSQRIQRGEGRPTIATFENHDVEWKTVGGRIFRTLEENLIDFRANLSPTVSVFVSESHAERARFLLAKLILNERLPVRLVKIAREELRLVEVKPEEVIETYTE